MKHQPIRIVHVIARMNVGGPAILISELLKGLNNKDFESFLITGNCESNEVDYLEANNLNFDEIRIKGFGRSINPISDLKSIFTIIRTLRKLKPDIVHTHTAKAGVIGRITSLVAIPNAKRVHTYHGHLLHGYFSKSKTLLVILIEKSLAKITDLILTVGNQVKKDLLAAGIGKAEKMQITFPGLSVNLKSDTKGLRKKIGIAEDDVVLIYVGRLTGIKRPDRLINAFRKACDECHNLTLLVIGDGELRAETERQAFGLKVKFLGWRTDVYELMTISDIAILTSDNEGMPITLIEAAHLGLPSISTNVGSVKDVVINAQTGYVTLIDEESISERIKQLAISKSLRDKFGKAAKLHAAENFSVNSMVDFHKKTYKSLLN